MSAHKLTTVPGRKPGKGKAPAIIVAGLLGSGALYSPTATAGGDAAARTKITQDTTACVPRLVSIPVETAGEFVPARQQWLAFYLGKMEPVIRELKMEVEPDAGGLHPVIPEAARATIAPLWSDWQQAIRSLNLHLDHLVTFFDDAADKGAEIRASATSLYNDARKLEQIRVRIFNALKELEKESPGTKILVDPTK